MLGCHRCWPKFNKFRQRPFYFWRKSTSDSFLKFPRIFLVICEILRYSVPIRDPGFLGLYWFGSREESLEDLCISCNGYSKQVKGQGNLVIFTKGHCHNLFRLKWKEFRSKIHYKYSVKMTFLIFGNYDNRWKGTTPICVQWGFDFLKFFWCLHLSSETRTGWEKGTLSSIVGGVWVSFLVGI